MTTTDRTPPDLHRLIDSLTRSYAPHATREDVLLCVRDAWDAVDYMGAADDAGMAELAGRIAERDLRLRLGLDREAARLDPERHNR